MKHKNSKNTGDSIIRWEMPQKSADVFEEVLPHVFVGSDAGDEQAEAYEEALRTIDATTRPVKFPESPFKGSDPEENRTVVWTLPKWAADVIVADLRETIAVSDSDNEGANALEAALESIHGEITKY